MTTIRLPDDLVAEIDKLRGLVPRERWVRDALEKHLAALAKQSAKKSR